MSWIVAGLIAGVVAYVSDWIMWSYVFNKGMDAFVNAPAPGQPMNMGPMLAKSAVLSLVFGLLLAYFYRQFMGRGGGRWRGWSSRPCCGCRRSVSRPWAVACGM